MSGALGEHLPEGQVRRAAVDEAVPVARLLARAFADDPIELWCLECDDLPGLLELEFLEVAKQLTAKGLLWVSDDLHGVAAWLPPGACYDDSIDAVVKPVLAEHGGRPERMVRFWEWVDSRRPTTPHWYVDLVAVDPDYRGCGQGRLLLEHGLARLDVLAATSYLVTGNPLTVPWYRRHGYVIRWEGPSPEGGPHVWFMLRRPRPDVRRLV
jgi:ribosomal protein S18 acetylase RimI-like enzyme